MQIFALCLNNPEYFQVFWILGGGVARNRTDTRSLSRLRLRGTSLTPKRGRKCYTGSVKPDILLLFSEGVNRWITKSLSPFLFSFFFTLRHGCLRSSAVLSAVWQREGEGLQSQHFTETKICPKERGSVGERQVEGLWCLYLSLCLLCLLWQMRQCFASTVAEL